MTKGTALNVWIINGPRVALSQLGFISKFTVVLFLSCFCPELRVKSR